MEESKARAKKGIVNMELSTFEIPPSGDILVLGKRCPIGPQAAIKMLDTVNQGQFEFVQVQDDLVEAIFIRKYLFKRVDKKTLIKAIVEEAKAIMDPQCMIRIKCDVTVKVEREL